MLGLYPICGAAICGSGTATIPIPPWRTGDLTGGYPPGGTLKGGFPPGTNLTGGNPPGGPLTGG